MKKLSTLFLLITCLYTANAQMDIQCNGRDQHAIYLVIHNDAYYRIDSVDTKPTAPKKLINETNDVGGISINANLDSSAGPTTMYAATVTSLDYFYWDGTKWIDTHHTTGSGKPYNPGGTDKYIFNLDALGATLYRYDGTGNATLLLSGLNTLGNKAVFDIACDNQGNFYIFYDLLSQVVMYNANGIPVDTLTTSGNPVASAKPGFAILGSHMYALLDYIMYEGTVSGHTINFVAIDSLSHNLNFSDIAACPNAANVLSSFKNVNAPHFAIYPNPATGYTTIKLNNTSSVEVYDCLGRRKLYADTKGLTEYNLNVAAWPAGIYFVRATSPQGQVLGHKLVVR